MPKRKKCLGVDLGSSAVKVAELSVDKAGVKVLNLAMKEINLTPGIPDTERQQIISKALKELLKENKISTREAIFCISGQSVFVRQIKLPKTSPERLKRIIHYEARQQIPFPLDKTIYEYQIFDSGEEDEVNVLLVALKKEFIIDFMTLIGRTGLKPVGVSVSSFALYNYFSFESKKETAKENKADKSKKDKKKGGKFDLMAMFKKAQKKNAKAEESAEDIDLSGDGMDNVEDIQFEEVKAYVNIGASTMDLAIARFGANNILGFTRSVPYAGNEMTRIIQDSCSLSSFQEAEQVKKNNTVVLSFGAEESLDENVNYDACEAATKSVDRIIADIRRSLDFYMAQPDGMAVDSIFLTGGQAAIPNIGTYIEDKLGLIVQVKSDTETPRIIFKNKPENLSPFVISVGLAMIGIGVADISIDFLPDEMKTMLEFKKKNILVFLNVVFIGAMVALSTQIGVRLKETYLSRSDSYLKEINQLDPLVKKLKVATDKRTALKDSYQYLDWALGKRDYWFPVILEIQKAKPSDMWIQELLLENGGRVKITGYSEKGESAATFTRDLQEAFKDIEGKPLVAEKEPELRNIFTEKPSPEMKDYFKFVIKFKLKGKISRIALEQPDPDEIKPGTTGSNLFKPGFGQPMNPGAPAAPGAAGPMGNIPPGLRK